MVMKSAASSSDQDTNRKFGELKYIGVRKRKWGKWVSEIRLPHSRERIWLGSYDSPEKAARAFDAAQVCLRGPSAANLNFPDNPPQVNFDSRRLSPNEIQIAAAAFANSDGTHQPPPPPPVVTMVEESPSPPSPSCSLSISDGTVQLEGCDVSLDGGPDQFYDFYDFNNPLGSGNYVADFGLGDFYAPQNSDSLDYYEYDHYNGSVSENSFLWNF